MKVIGFVSSPHENGNTTKLVTKALEGAASAGAETELINVAKLTINGCKGCGFCKTHDGCAQKDDFEKVRQAIISADGIVFGSPIFFFDLNAQARCVEDRLFCFLTPDMKSKVPAGKKCIFTPDGRCQLPGENSLKPYKVEEMYEMPSDIITTASGKQFQVHITAKGLELWSGIYDNDENFTPDDNVLALTRTASPYGDGRWAWASTQLVTQSLAGCHNAEVLRLIRNEIWARHGYRFSSSDLQQNFSSQPWYRPVADNAAIQLTDVEKLNVDLLKAIETDIRKQQ